MTRQRRSGGDDFILGRAGGEKSRYTRPSVVL